MTDPNLIDVTVCVHAWAYDLDENGNATLDQTYCDADTSQPDGWCVYTRHDFDTDPAIGEPFDLIDETDFDTEAEAMAEAERRADLLGCKLHTY